MPSATEKLDSKGGGTSKLLRGSDLPKSMREIKIEIAECREAPESFNSALILDIEPVLDDRASFPLNKTNTRSLVSFLGDDYSRWVGAKVTLQKIPVNNPQTRQQTFGLVVIDARPARAGKRSKSKGKRKSGSDNDVPF